MNDVLENIEIWQERGDDIAVATVIQTWGSSPRAPGAKMIVNQNGEMFGSVSGGCVEGAVVEEALQVLKSGKPKTAPFWRGRRACLGSGIGLWRHDRSICGATGLVSDNLLFPLLKDYIKQDRSVALANRRARP